uniref:Protein kinase domain-containing protein n=1 Tax=Chromera velia CCMP2878 TaxID=1169474 RepID=A0A0G4IG94_9ALVE|eukprot:Cvel_125.t1-p1 / transcript=Cvel_125.t1 / gene=Cvel_125 / organism=Chromera_velia_CCMP2878 / gene_product=Extracellular signal-regulated kinase 1, putative / transcript_product=Extracellular signal-regulated kinase 1, putative / location=Cvel_scaffold9:62021-64874(+) / protein_length=469 / sequence_SO=supercontig / SO=protein_coding / is_pseudo=false
MAKGAESNLSLHRPEPLAGTFAQARRGSAFEQERETENSSRVMLQSFGGRYVDLGIPGCGTRGTVRVARDIHTGRLVAVKSLQDCLRSEAVAKRTLRELRHLRHLQGHENVLEVVDVEVVDSTRRAQIPIRSVTELALVGGRPVLEGIDVLIVSGLMETDLGQILGSRQPLSLEHCRLFLYQLLRGLKYIHSAGVVHGDLEPKHLLVNSDCDLRICDYGLSRFQDPPVAPPPSEHAPEQGHGLEGGGATLTEPINQFGRYRAPELLCSFGFYGPLADVWSVGCILAEMTMRRRLFDGTDARSLLVSIAEVMGIPSEEDLADVPQEALRHLIRTLPTQQTPSMSPSVVQCRLSRLFGCREDVSDCADLLCRMLSLSPKQRISVEAALQHPFLSELHLEEDEPSRATLNREDVVLDELSADGSTGRESGKLEALLKELLEERRHWGDATAASGSLSSLSASTDAPSDSTPN